MRISNNKIILSKSEWLKIGQSANWNPTDLSDRSDKDLPPIYSPDEEEEFIFGKDEEITDDMVYNDGFRTGKFNPNNNFPPYRTDTERGKLLFDIWKRGFNDGVKESSKK